MQVGNAVLHAAPLQGILRVSLLGPVHPELFGRIAGDFCSQRGPLLGVGFVVQLE